MAAAAPSAGKEAFPGNVQQREGAIASGSGLGQTWHRSLCLQEAHCPVRETPHVAPLVKEMAEYDQDWKSSAGKVLGEGGGRRRDFRLGSAGRYGKLSLEGLCPQCRNWKEPWSQRVAGRVREKQAAPIE